MTQNQLAYWRDQETKRANLAKEEENIRTNKENESIKRRDVRTKERSNELSDYYNRWKYNNEDTSICEKTINDFIFTPLTKVLGGLFS